MQSRLYEIILKFPEKLPSLSSLLAWRGLVYVVAASFVLASLISLLCAHLLLVGAGKRYEEEAPVAPAVVATKESFLTPTDVDKIIKRNIFNIEGKTAEDEENKEDQAAAAAAASNQVIKCTLPIKLVGTIYGGTPSAGLALIEDTTKKNINSFLVGDMLREGAKLVEVHRDRVILERGDHREFLELQMPKIEAGRRANKGKAKLIEAVPKGPRYATEPPPEDYKEEGFERHGSEITLSKEFRQKMLTTDFAKVLQDAKAEPHFEDGVLTGFRLTRIREESIYQKAGLQNDDIIKEINGVSLIDTAQAIKLLNSLRGESEIEVRLNRGGRTMTVNMQVR